MLTTMETCLRNCQRTARKWALDPRVQAGAKGLAWGGSGFFLSAAALSGGFQPLAMGLITALTAWPAVLAALGAMAGYRLFWGAEGLLGMIWAGAGCLMALVSDRGNWKESYPLLVPALTAVVAAVSGLIFLFFRPGTAFRLFFLRIVLAPVAALFFRQAVDRRDSVTEWTLGGIAVLALAPVGPLGYGAGAVLSRWGSFPAAAMAGLGLDLARVTRLPMAVVLCAGWFGRMIPFQDRRLAFAVPGLACLGVMALTGIWDPAPLPGLVLGGAVGVLLPPRRESVRRQGELGVAQVRLELTADVLARTQRLLLLVQEPEVDGGALLNRAINRACGNCPARESCVERANLSEDCLEHPLSFVCRRPWEIQGELLRAQERLRDLKADRQRRQEYRSALIQQYQFLSVYLQKLSDQLPRRGERKTAVYRLEVSARSRGKERSCGDRCMAFSGTGCRYYVLLCDGMGTGLGAAAEGQSAGELLRQMLSAGFPPEHAFRSLNALLVLRGQAGAVTLDLAELRLDSGRVFLYKWGAAPSYLLRKSGTEKIGTATPPPGLDLGHARETVEKLSLRRGEVLILVSDGVRIGEVLSHEMCGPLPPGELAEWLLEKSGADGEDDATVAVMRLSPRRLST